MLSGNFENCYGIKKLTLPQIQFDQCNKAVIYAPNGVMKTSFTKVFEDISKGIASSDRIFKNEVTAYSIIHHTFTYQYSSANLREIPQSNYIYVINSFTDKFEFTKDNVGTLLADEATRNEYNKINEQLAGTIRDIEEKLRAITGLTKPQIKGKLIADFELSATSDWPDIFDALHSLEQKEYHFLKDISYNELFNDKTTVIYDDQNFRQNIEDYITSLNNL